MECWSKVTCPLDRPGEGTWGPRGDKKVSARYLLVSPGPLFLSQFDRATTNYTILRGFEDVGCRILEDIGDGMLDVGRLVG